jgi:hypothetical protein
LGISVEDGIDEVVNTSPKVLLKDIHFHVLEEVKSVFARDYAFHWRLLLKELVNYYIIDLTN